MTNVVPSVRSHAVWPVLFGVAMLAGVTAAGIGALSLADALIATGLPNPGPVTNYGLPFVRAAGEIAGVVAVGSFMFAAFLVPPQQSGVLDADGYRALRLGTVASGIWTVCAALLVPLTVSDVTGQPLTSRLSPSDIWSVASLVETAGAWRWTAFLAAIVTIASIRCCGGRRRRCCSPDHWSRCSAGAHRALVFRRVARPGRQRPAHLPDRRCAAGGRLLALLVHALRGGGHAGLAARRFSAVALWCFVAMALSGVVNALVRIRPGELFDGRYGWLIIAKAVALCTLGVIGWRQRRSGVAALKSDPDARGPLVRLALTEAVIFGLTFGVAVALSRTPPPPPPIFNPSIPAIEIGYDFAGPPTVARVLFDWRFDLVFGTAAIVMAVLYLAGVQRLRRRGDQWPTGRIVAWLLGCLVLLFATSSGVGRYMPAMFSMHMAAHMLLSMLTPVLLVLGAPVTLLQSPSALPGRARKGS
jgi:putative copper resistance protein D